MEETQPAEPAVRSVALEDADTPELLSVRLSVVEDHEAHAVSTPDQLLSNENLLTLGATDVRDVRPLGELCVGIGCDEADRWAR
jgi:hypothetical protein